MDPSKDNSAVIQKRKSEAEIEMWSTNSIVGFETSYSLLFTALQLNLTEVNYTELDTTEHSDAGKALVEAETVENDDVSRIYESTKTVGREREVRA